MIQKIRKLLGRVILALLPYRTYDLLIAVPRHTTYEDPKCPSRWKGSGCYDIDLYGWQYFHLKVCARTELEVLDAFRTHQESLYKETYKDTFERYKEYSFAESSAREHAEDASYADCEILAVIPCPENDGLTPLHVEECKSHASDWSSSEDECLLEDALKFFNLKLA